MPSGSSSAGERLRTAMLEEAAKSSNYAREVSWKDEWTAKTSCASMSKLVKQREAVFAKQRKVKNDIFQTLSYAFTATHLSRFSASNAVPRNTLRAYHRFCLLHRIPAFPLCPALIAL
ncbi:hypothetical protein JCM6882_003252 [Rhodosporidiobolus microsporus]